MLSCLIVFAQLTRTSIVKRRWAFGLYWAGDRDVPILALNVVEYKGDWPLSRVWMVFILLAEFLSLLIPCGIDGIVRDESCCPAAILFADVNLANLVSSFGHGFNFAKWIFPVGC